MGSFHIKCIFPPLRPTCDPPRLSTHAAAQTGNLDRDPPGLSRNKSFGFYFLPRPPANQGGRINEKKKCGIWPTITEDENRRFILLSSPNHISS